MFPQVLFWQTGVRAPQTLCTEPHLHISIFRLKVRVRRYILLGILKLYLTEEEQTPRFGERPS